MTLLPPANDTLKARLKRALHPGSGWCMCCGMPWAAVETHETRYGEGFESCFPLCENCWTELGSPEARIEYYKMLIDSWELDLPVDEDKKRNIQMAVANGG